MRTPIFSFLKEYGYSDTLRLHMPGHKGFGDIGIEHYDITEIKGADSLFEADGIIAQSEKNAGKLFGAHTFYSTEGSSLSIRAMVYLASMEAKHQGRPNKILASRNAHKSFISAAALVGVEVEWLDTDIEECRVLRGSDGCECYLASGDAYAAFLHYLASPPSELPIALYITSPDYLGNMQLLEAIGRLCKKANMLFLVDNAHGAYLKFLEESRHPMDLGADMCADSAHKTLPALTGAAYLHISKSLPDRISSSARSALSLFASTSPSYLILASLDLVNKRIAGGYAKKIRDMVEKLEKCKHELSKYGYKIIGDEPMKITISAKNYGYLGYEFAEALRERGVEPEFADPDFVVLMPSPLQIEALPELVEVLKSIKMKDALDRPECRALPPLRCGVFKVLSVREALLSPSETVPVERSLGRILADLSVGCPPAVPIIASGERITERAIASFEYYGISSVRVVKE